jgi:hypothetical protein
MSNKNQTGYRSAKTGHFVTEKYGKAHPNTTEKETLKKGDTKKK